MEIEGVIRHLAEQQYGVVGRRQLNELGIDNQALRPLLARGAVARVTDQVLRVPGSVPDSHQETMIAVLDSPPGAMLSHRSAAALWKLPGFHLHSPFHVIVPRQGRPQRSPLAIIHYQKDLPLDQVVILRGIPVTSPPLTIFHLAAMLHPAHTERTLDNAVARGLLSPAKLAALVRRLAASGRNGTRVSRELAEARIDGHRPPESGFEHRVTWCAAQAGVEVECQVPLGDHEFVGRADFRLVGLPGVIEAQSTLYHAAPMDRTRDRERVEGMLRSGFSVLFVWDRQVFGNSAVVIREIQRFHRDVETTQRPFFRDCPDQ